MGLPVITPGTSTREEAIVDLVTSIAMEQTALSHILNAEGEKIEKIVESATTAEELLAVNASVEEMVTAITALEVVLQSKLSLFQEEFEEETTDDTTT